MALTTKPPREGSGSDREKSRTPPKRRKFGIYIALAASVLGMSLWLAGRQGDPLDDLSMVDGRPVNARLLTLPANRWIQISPKLPKFAEDFPSALQTFFPSPGLGWRRQGHAGLAFDSLRDSLLIFGSDSHNENWDNSVHEFSLLTLEWTTHYPPSPKETYRADPQGAAIAGDDGAYPWAMHTYDNIVYALPIDALVVTSQTDHTPPPTEEAKKARANPTWIYPMETHAWEMLPQRDNPSFFAAGSTYDPNTRSVWAYKSGQLWRLDLVKGNWIKTAGRHATGLEMHFTLIADVRRRQLLIFGDYRKSNAIWVYTPAVNPDEAGRWEKRQPGGDACPKDDHLPVAYDSQQGVFLLLPDESPQQSVTLVYDPDDNRYIRIHGADMPANKMNYMMEYDPYHRLFLLVTGDGNSPLRVWAFRLDMAEPPLAGSER
jgi:hypothetical protein